MRGPEEPPLKGAANAHNSKSGAPGPVARSLAVSPSGGFRPGPRGPASMRGGIGCEALVRCQPGPGRGAPAGIRGCRCIAYPRCAVLSCVAVGSPSLRRLSRPSQSLLRLFRLVSFERSRAPLRVLCLRLDGFPRDVPVSGSAPRTPCAPALSRVSAGNCSNSRRRLCTRGEDPGRTPKEAGTRADSLGSRLFPSIGVLPPHLRRLCRLDEPLDGRTSR